jgi:hypothetical protein
MSLKAGYCIDELILSSWPHRNSSDALLGLPICDPSLTPSPHHGDVNPAAA